MPTADGSVGQSDICHVFHIGDKRRHVLITSNVLCYRTPSPGSNTDCKNISLYTCQIV